jgi:hypothetical protein
VLAGAGAVAMVYQMWALLCVQSFTTGTVAVRRIAQTELAGELTALVPDVPAATAMPITLPPGVAGDASRLLADVTDDTVARRRLRDLLRVNGGDPDVVDRLADLLPSPACRGQLGATRRTGGRTGTELSWLDGPAGRVRVDHADDGWTSINPLRHHDLRLAVAEAATTARAL